MAGADRSSLADRLSARLSREPSAREEPLLIGPRSAAADVEARWDGLTRVSNPIMVRGSARSSRASDLLSSRLSAPEPLVLSAPPAAARELFPEWLAAGTVVASGEPDVRVGHLLSAPDLDGEVLLRWVGTAQNSWAPASALEQPTPSQLRLASALEDVEAVPWIHSSHGEKFLRVTWRRRLSRRLLCTSAGLKLSWSYSMLNRLRDGSVSRDSDWCVRYARNTCPTSAALEVERSYSFTQHRSDGGETKLTNDGTSPALQLCLDQGIESKLVPLDALDAADDAEAIVKETEAWAAHHEAEQEKRAELQIEGRYTEAERRELRCLWLLPTAMLSSCAASVALALDGLGWWWRLSCALHLVAGCAFVGALRFTTVKGLPVSQGVAYICAFFLGALGFAPAALFWATYSAALALARSPVEMQSQSLHTTQHSRWLRGIGMTMTIPHACLLGLVLLLSTPSPTTATICLGALGAISLNMLCDPNHGLIARLFCRGLLPAHRRLLLVSSVHGDDLQMGHYRGADYYTTAEIRATVYWCGRKIDHLQPADSQTQEGHFAASAIDWDSVVNLPDPPDPMPEPAGGYVPRIWRDGVRQNHLPISQRFHFVHFVNFLLDTC